MLTGGWCGIGPTSVCRVGEDVVAAWLDDEVARGSSRRVLLLRCGDAMVGTIMAPGHHGHGGLGLGGSREQDRLYGSGEREMVRARLAKGVL
jgi:hypothetical protein